MLHVLGRREAADTQDRSGAVALGPRTALLNELAALNARRAKLKMERSRAVLEDARAIVVRARAMLRAAGIAAETSILPGQPEAALSKLIEDAGYDMLVMGAYGHSRIRSLTIGSTTTAMIRASKVPVVLMR